MKTMMKVFAMMLALILTVSLFAACGGSDSKTTADATEAAAESGAEAQTTTWGEITLVVPDGMHMIGGNGTFDPDDVKTLWIYDDENELHYIKVSIVDSEENAAENVELTRSINEEYNPGDATEDLDNGTWKGVCYDYNGTPCTICYCTVGEKVFLVMTYGYEMNTSGALDTVLGSLN